jgi:hypothetical protein
MTMSLNCSMVLSRLASLTVNMPIDGFDIARRQLDIAAPERGLDVGDGQLARGEFAPVEPDADGISPGAENVDIGDAFDGAEPVGEVALDIVGDLRRRHAVAGDGDAHDRIGIGIALDDARLVDVVRQASADPTDRVAHIVGGLVDIAAADELHRGTAAPGAAFRGMVLTPLMPAMAPSMTSVMSESMISGAAPV